MKKLVVLPNDPLIRYYEKGEVKDRYFNPCDYFDEVHVISLSVDDIEPAKVSQMAGRGTLFIHTPGAPALTSIFPLRQKVLALVRDIQPDCIRAYNPLLMGWYAAYCGQQLNIPTVMSIHDDFSIWRRRKTYGTGFWTRAAYQLAYRVLFERYTFTYTNTVICVYDFIRTRYVEHFRRDGIEVIYNRIDLSRFQGKTYVQDSELGNEQDRSDQPLRLIWVGRLFKGKNPTPIIQAMQDLPVELTLIGQGPLKEQLQNLVKQLNLQERVRFIDAVPNADLPGYYANHDIFAFSSVLPGISIPIFEAMASGLPIVINKPLWDETTPVAGDIAFEVENTSEGYREALAKLLRDAHLREKMGRQAREKALQYDGSLMEEKEKDVYQQLL